MKLSKIKVRREFFRSLVAKRVFFLFVLCALIPLTTLTYLSYKQVTIQLHHQASTQLHQTCKSAGMSIIERLQFLENELIELADFKNVNPKIKYSLMKKYAEHFKNHCNGIILIIDNNRIVKLIGSIQDPPQLKEDEQIHIRNDKTLILVRSSTNRLLRIFMVRSFESSRPYKNLVIAEIYPEYLWGSSDFFSPENELLVVDQSMHVLFSSLKEYSPLKELENASRKNNATGKFTWQYGGTKYLSGYWTIYLQPKFHVNWIIVYSQPEDTIWSPIYIFKKIFLFIVVLTFLLILFLSYRQIKKYLIPIEILQDATRRIAAKDFSRQIQIKSNDEFEELGSSFNEMSNHLEKHFKVLTAINKIGIALFAEKDNNRLMEIVLEGAKSITNADGCVLYTSTVDESLKLSIMRIDSLALINCSQNQKNIPLYDDNRNPNNRTFIAYSIHNNASVNIPNIYTAKEFDSSDIIVFDKQTGYRSQSFLNVPMKNHENEFIGVIQLINKIDKISGDIIPFSEEDQRLIETLAYQAAVALSKNKLIEDFKKLFDSLIELFAKAIDEKSPYTGEHCRRVPELTMMLAEAVMNQNDGVFKDFTLSEEELYELKVAALLHDCGKVVTPVHIVDKARRLETIFDRIHLINARFEIIKRDVQIDLLKKKLKALQENSDKKSSDIEEELKDVIWQFEKDRDFIRTSNGYKGIMSQKIRLRLEEISQKYRWLNADGDEVPVISDEELYALTASDGTLTPAEWNIIKQHVVTTAKMLESLPYPKSLRNVPQFAAVHHERVDGKGYPNGLTKDEIPLQGKIIAIADIFEALTAKNRPYKKSKTLMKALRDLGYMKLNGQIDPDLFDVFINEGVYLKYAEKYLAPEEIDAIDLYEIPGYVSKEMKLQNAYS